MIRVKTIMLLLLFTRNNFKVCCRSARIICNNLSSTCFFKNNIISYNFSTICIWSLYSFIKTFLLVRFIEALVTIASYDHLQSNSRHVYLGQNNKGEILIFYWLSFYKFNLLYCWVKTSRIIGTVKYDTSS